MAQELVLCSVFLCGTVFYFVNAIKIPFGKLVEPGPGFFPVILGVLAVSINLFLLSNALMKYLRDKGQRARSEDDEVSPKSWRIYAYLGSFVMFMMFLKAVGAPVAIFILVIALTKISGVRGWKLPVLIGAASSLMIVLVFGIWLKTQLPYGPFKIF